MPDQFDNAQAKKASSTPLVELQPRGATNVRLPHVIAASNVPQQCVAFRVAPGLTVTLFGLIGLAVNAHDVFAAHSSDELLAGHGMRIAAGESVPFPVDSTGQIWFAGTAADGLLVSVTGVAVG